MSFLQPWMLFALPLISVPIIIHLVNQRRFQTVPWAAMRFLLEANRMSSGYTRLRQWLILAMRTLALLALVLFTARPLTSGLLALLSGESNAVAIVILDRSPSMGDLQPGSNRTRLESAIEQLATTFQTLGVQRVVQIDANADKPEEFPSIAQWMRAVPRTAWTATSDVPGLLEQALVYAKNNPSGNTMVWLCSDMRDGDWRSRDGRWAAVRDGFKALPQDVRFSILDMAADRSENRSIRMTDVKCVEGANGRELSLSFRVDRSPGSPSQGKPESSGAESGGSSPLPVEIAVGGSRTVLNLDLSSNSAQVNDHRIPLDSDGGPGSKVDRGWGWVRLPSDSNPTDDASYFVFEQPPVRRTLIVSDSPELVSAIELCASIAPQQSIRCESELVSPSQLPSMALDGVALIVWHDRLPSEKSLEILQAFLDSGGQLLLVPPESPDDTKAFGIRWKDWETVQPSTPIPMDNNTVDDNTADDGSSPMARIAQWQNDSQLLANTLSGSPLPLGQLGIRRVCRVEGDLISLATLPDGHPLLGTIASQDAAPQRGSVVVCATTPSDRDSTLAGDGVVLYVAIQRMLAAGAQRTATVRQSTAGIDGELVDANALFRAGNESAPSSEYSMHAGVYEGEGTLVAIERNPLEDEPKRVDDESLTRMFGELTWVKVGLDKRSYSLIQEIWRWFVLLMLGALILEALLCLPRLRRPIATKPSVRS